MKRIMSISLGSPVRNHRVETEILGEQVIIERIGTGGSIPAAMALIRRWDGRADAFGLGGIDLYIRAGGRRYVFRDAQRIAGAAACTPVADGSGLKNTLERKAILDLNQKELPFQNKKVLMVSSVDRFGMAEALHACGAQLILGDVMFGLGLEVPLHTPRQVARLGKWLLPVLTKVPFSWLYPTGAKQEKREPKYEKYYHWADIIAGDFLYIQRHMPGQMAGKIIITNTVTPADRIWLQRCGIRRLITTTPELNGRSFGTNVMEALIVAFAGKRAEELSESEYYAWIERLSIRSEVTHLKAVPEKIHSYC